jgi:5-formyltetrahydrofolate cyclo-ligase
MFKKDLRLNYISLREGLAPEDLFNGSLAIANQSLKVPIWEGEFYHLFLPISDKKEVDTSFILSILQGKDKNVVLSKVSAKNRLRHFLLTDSTTLQLNTWGIPEPTGGIAVDPKQLDVVFVPLLSFDVLGNRVGYGQGFYDRFLNECRKDTLKVGLSLFDAAPNITDSEAHDVRLDYCITPEKIYTFKSV